MILYPTETIYGLGVNPFDEEAMAAVFALKGRDERKVSAWLVPSVEDMHRFAILSSTAERIAAAFLPGPLTLVLPARETVPSTLQSEAGTIGVRVSADPYAQDLIARFWQLHNAPLTCTSANISGLPTEATPEAIEAQFRAERPDFTGFATVIDGGERTGAASTVVHVVGDRVSVIREGVISEAELQAVGA
jgi:L-threonylcarbamoyladenylate synthase